MTKTRDLLTGTTVVVGISSGIAAYKIVDLIRILKDKGISVEIIITANAVSMFGKGMFEKAAGKRVHTDLIEKGFDYKEVLKNREVEHIKIADSASLFVIAPATANIIAKLACGIADDFLTTTILAATAPVLICPSMNVHMWENPLFRENLNRLKALNFLIMSPDKGELACGYEGVGRLAAPEKIAQEILKILTLKKNLKAKKIMVTAGGTAEPIDAVRTITNRASGKMGVAITEECIKQSAEVLLLCTIQAINHIKLPWREKSKDTSEVTRRGSSDGGGIRQENRLMIELFETSSDLERLIKKHIRNHDVLFHTAAVSDFVPEEKPDVKLDSGKPFSLKLSPAPKILHKIKSWNPKIKLIGFKAVYKLPEKELINVGIRKLKESGSDYIIVNDVGREGVGFSVDTNEVYIIHQAQGRALSVKKIHKAPKKEIAEKILNFIFP